MPGPFWASISNSWYTRALARGDSECLKLRLHKTYGESLISFSEMYV
jgi:hypothetical protein